ncbi:hypothetical protein HDU93_008851 [Gonapodya sp. JEL0774]|nr:hypothetical protein HDU93_008851 [Gonapodya sp. JEL0774]
MPRRNHSNGATHVNSSANEVNENERAKNAGGPGKETGDFQVPRTVLAASRKRQDALVEKKLQRLASSSDVSPSGGDGSNRAATPPPRGVVSSNHMVLGSPPRTRTSPNREAHARSAGFIGSRHGLLHRGSQPGLGASVSSTRINVGTTKEMVSIPSTPKRTPVSTRSPSPEHSPPRMPPDSLLTQSSSIPGSPPPTDRTLHNIERLAAARTLRREANAAQQALLRGMSPQERETARFRDDVGKFRAEFSKQWDDWEDARAETYDAGQTDDSSGESVERYAGNMPNEALPTALRPGRFPKIRVCVRKRPLNSKEISLQLPDSLTLRTSTHPNSHIYVHRPIRRLDTTVLTTTHKFSFDDVFDEQASNWMLYQGAIRPLVDSLFRKGGRCSVFCYGQTGSGKTYTVFGPEGGRPGALGDPGVYQHACEDIFRRLTSINARRAAANPPVTPLTCTASYFELYSGRVFDLLAHHAPRQLLEDSRGDVQILGLARVPVRSAEECFQMAARGAVERTTGRTEANDTSSRSHAVFQIVVWEEEVGRSGEEDTSAFSTGSAKRDSKVYSKFSLIDLAGSERGQDTGQGGTRQQRMEASEINKSLLALKECIRALHARHLQLSQVTPPATTVSPFLPPPPLTSLPHVPFRASKLTQLLRDSFVHRGSRTVMIAAVSPAASAVEHTLNTLRYAGRVKEVNAGDGVGVEGGERGECIVESPDRVVGWGDDEKDAEGEASVEDEGDDDGDEEEPSGREHRIVPDEEDGVEELVPESDLQGTVATSSTAPGPMSPQAVRAVPAQTSRSIVSSPKRTPVGGPSRLPGPRRPTRSPKTSTSRITDDVPRTTDSTSSLAGNGNRNRQGVAPRNGKGVPTAASPGASRMGSNGSLGSVGSLRSRSDKGGSGKGPARVNDRVTVEGGQGVSAEVSKVELDPGEELVAAHLRTLDAEMTMCRADEELLSLVTGATSNKHGIIRADTGLMAEYVKGLHENLEKKISMLEGLKVVVGRYKGAGASV